MPKKTTGKYVVVLVTCGSRAEAQRIAREIVSRRLAACANLVEMPVQSVYRWKGRVEKAREFLLLIKTSARRLPALQAEVQRFIATVCRSLLPYPSWPVRRNICAGWLSPCS